VLIIPSSWGSQQAVTYKPSTSFLVPLPGRKKTYARGVSHAQSFTLFLFCFILLLLASFYQKYKKISSLIVVAFTYLLFSLARMSNHEVEVHTFKQQGGESLKDAWYGISNAHHRCTKKHSTMILLRNFYVGISSWNRYVLDTLAGGNFLGTPALEACMMACKYSPLGILRGRYDEHSSKSSLSCETKV
jgi:hypothetical protein